MPTAADFFAGYTDSVNPYSCILNKLLLLHHSCSSGSLALQLLRAGGAVVAHAVKGCADGVYAKYRDLFMRFYRRAL
jgi:hypothetical protein